MKDNRGKSKVFLFKNQACLILFWFKPFIKNTFLLVHGIANVRQCFRSTGYLNFKQNSESEEQ